MSLPVLLYTLPRARGTVCLMRSIRPNKLNEPFHVARDIKVNNTLPDYFYLMPGKTEQEFNKIIDWGKMVTEMESTDSCTKFHGHHLEIYRPGKVWYRSMIAAESHTIFVIEREDRENQLLSALLAGRHGWHRSEQQVNPIELCEITKAELQTLKFFITSHLINFPTYGTVVTYDTLPESHFVKGDFEEFNQHSLPRHKFLLNLDYCKEVIADLLEYYKEEWDEKIRTIKPNKF